MDQYEIERIYDLCKFAEAVVQDKGMDIYIIKNLSSINRKIGFITE